MRVSWLALLGALACTHADPEPAPAVMPSRPRAGTAAGRSRAAASLTDVLGEEMAPDRAIAWSAARRLAWSDFQGTPPSGGPEGALTAYALFYAWRCRGSVFEFRVIAGFRPGASWVKPVVLRDSVESRRALRHEQTHFDLTEVHARRMRQLFGDLADPCGRSDRGLEALADRIVREERAAQHRYDDESSHGLTASKQAAWQNDVARQLAALARYAGT